MLEVQDELEGISAAQASRWRRSRSWVAEEQAIGRPGRRRSKQLADAAPGRRRALATRAGDGQRKNEGKGDLFVTDFKLRWRFCKIRSTLSCGQLFPDGGSSINIYSLHSKIDDSTLY